MDMQTRVPIHPTEAAVFRNARRSPAARRRRLWSASTPRRSVPRVEDLAGDLRGRMLAIRSCRRRSPAPCAPSPPTPASPGAASPSRPTTPTAARASTASSPTPSAAISFETFVGPSRAGAFDAVQLDYDQPRQPVLHPSHQGRGARAASGPVARAGVAAAARRAAPGAVLRPHEFSMKALVTGAAGFIGSHVARLLVEAGHEVRALHLPGEDLRNLDGLDCEKFAGDVTDGESMRRASAGCEQVFHLAAIYALWTRQPERLWQVNVEGTRTVLDAARKNGVRRVIVTSSIARFGGQGRAPDGSFQRADRDEPVRAADRSLFAQQGRRPRADAEVGVATSRRRSRPGGAHRPHRPRRRRAHAHRPPA